MNNTPFTARNIAKFVVMSAIAHKSADIAEDAITEHTRFEEDDLIVTLGSQLIGWGIADTVKPYTDKMVDKTADFIATKRQNRKLKKTTTEEK